jgi:hypothetical protein
VLTVTNHLFEKVVSSFADVIDLRKEIYACVINFLNDRHNNSLFTA